MTKQHELHEGGHKNGAPGDQVGHVVPDKDGTWRLRRPSPSGMSGVAIGGIAGAAVAGPVGALVGMVIGGAAGEAIERQFPSAGDDAAASRA